MEEFSENHANLLLNKEWLVKIDVQKSVPYLFKVYTSTDDLSCCILMTDMKSCWAEVMSNQQFARRWRAVNPEGSHPFLSIDEEEQWRRQRFELLSRAHTIGGASDMNFEVVESNYSDLAFELEWDTFKWRWETNWLGHKRSAEIISKQLITPLISVNHLALGQLETSDPDLEKAIDKVAKAGRRTIDTHVRNVLSKPRMATTLRRTTALLNFASDPPGVVSDVDTPDLQVPAAKPGLADVEEPQTRSSLPGDSVTTSKTLPYSPNTNEPLIHASIGSPGPSTAPDITLSLGGENGKSRPNVTASATHSDSTTESDDDDDDDDMGDGNRVNVFARSTTDNERESQGRATSPPGPLATEPEPSMSGFPNSRGKQAAPAPDTDSSPARPTAKKQKVAQSSEDEDLDSEEERKRRVARLKSGAGTRRGGARQPIKRGGRKF